MSSFKHAADALKRAHAALSERREADGIAALSGARVWLQLESEVGATKRDQEDAARALATVRRSRDYLACGIVHQAKHYCENAMQVLDEIMHPEVRAENDRRMFDSIQQDADLRWKFVEDDDHPDPEAAMAAAEYWGELREGR